MKYLNRNIQHLGDTDSERQILESTLCFGQCVKAFIFVLVKKKLVAALSEAWLSGACFLLSV